MNATVTAPGQELAPVLRLSLQGETEAVLRLKAEPILRLKMHPGFVVLSEVNDSKVFDTVESLVDCYAENADKIAMFKDSVDAAVSSDPLATLNSELMASLYTQHAVPHELQHDAFSEEFLQRWRARINDMIARSLAEPHVAHTLNFLYLHSAKVLNKSFLAKAIIALSSEGSPNLQTLLLDFVPAAMHHDWGIAAHVPKMHDNHAVVLSLTTALLAETASRLPPNLIVNVVLTDTVRNASPEIEAKLAQLQLLLWGMLCLFWP